MCTGMKGTHIETSQTPLTYSKRVGVHIHHRTAVVFFVRFFPPICTFFFYFTPFTRTPSTVLLPYPSQHLVPQPHEPRTQSSSDNEMVTATEKILTNQADYPCAKKKVHLTRFKNPVSLPHSREAVCLS